jgi:glycerol kinase
MSSQILLHITHCTSFLLSVEGSVSHSGSTIQWLRDQLNIISEAREADILAGKTKHNDGLYFVPAFSGLFAPFWRSDARGCIVGMTATHHKGHICRSALEASAYQAREVFDAMYADSNVVLRSLRVDGGGTQSSVLMQFQADMLEVPVERPLVMETTALGAAFAAGLATGVWKDLNEIRGFWEVSKTFYPKMKHKDREKLWMGWKKAVDRSLGWVEPEPLAGSIRRRTVFSLLRRKLRRARRRYMIKIQRSARNLFWAR